MLLFRAWWRRGEKERRGVEVVSSCIFLVLPPWKQMQWLSEFSAADVWGRFGICAEGLPGPTDPSEVLRELSLPPTPPDWLLCLKLPEENSCCTVLLLSWEMLTWKALAVLVQLGGDPCCSSGTSAVAWAELQVSSLFLPSWALAGMDVGFQFPPLVWQCRVRSQREQIRRDYKVPVEFFKVFRGFIFFKLSSNILKFFCAQLGQ